MKHINGWILALKILVMVLAIMFVLVMCVQTVYGYTGQTSDNVTIAVFILYGLGLAIVIHRVVEAVKRVGN